ncbi:SusC/RagA family TonB-linked outer membrane protein [Wenyingzhuangia sp. IMCC45467]
MKIKHNIKHFLLLLGVLLTLPIYAQKNLKISGIVTDQQGMPLPGATVLVQNTSVGTITDFDGKYEFSIPETAKTLEFIFTGMKNQLVKMKEGQLVVNVSMKPDTESLDEVVIVAFGQQKKTDMIGSVSTINTKDLQKFSTSNLTTALAGQAAGVIAYQRGGEPGDDNAEFFIRGVTTFGSQANRSPLILIDGIELTTTDLARLQKDNIESFSILKDATATSLYGARGANGVILVQTKQGVEGPAKISLRIENSTSAPTRNIKFSDPVTFMQMYNQAVIARDPLGEQANTPYSQQKIDNTILGTNKYVYPSTDWQSMLFKDHTTNRRVNLNVSGGGKVARYYVSGSYNNDNGILKTQEVNNFNNNIKLKTYSLRSNVNVDISPSTELVVRLNGVFDDYTGPLNGGAEVYNMVVRSNPVLFPAYYPIDEDHKFVNHVLFGNSDQGQFLNPYAQLVRGYKDYSRSKMLAQFEVNQDLSDIIEGLNWSTMVNTTRSSYFDVSRSYSPFYYEPSGYNFQDNSFSLFQLNPDTGSETLGNPQGGEKTINSTFFIQSRLMYDHKIGEKNKIGALLVFRMQEDLNSDFTSLQTSLPSRNMGLSGRTTYTYDNRYFAEFNFGYNGSERFHESKRYGFFPSAGLAWTISNEKFWEPLKEVINNFRIRGSYGLVGNDGIGSATDRFFYLSEVSLNNSGRGATFGRDGGYFKNGVSISRYANPDITWEIAYKTNVALELSIWKKLNVNVDFFRERRTNILMSREAIPNTMGLQTTIKANLGEASGQGVDLSADFTHSWMNGAWLSARANFTYATNKYEVFEEPDYNEPWRSRIGQSLQQTYGYIAERLFIDDAEAQNSPTQAFGGSAVGGGDIKYSDVNGDGEITTADMVPIGNPTLPEIVYGFGFSFGYKNLDVSAFFQGLANESFWINPTNITPFATSSGGGENQVLQVIADSYWSESNKDVYAFWPKLDTGVNPNNTQTSTWWMRDGSFLRLKQLEIGYNLSDLFKDKYKVSRCRLYINGSNLLTFSKFKKWDVEMGGNGLGYPVQRTINLGVNIGFN